MSRSYNQISTPNQRGRFSVKRSKRLASKKVRRIPIDVEIDSTIDKQVRSSEPIDKNSLGDDYNRKVRY